jgi:hypothetical protein
MWNCVEGNSSPWIFSNFASPPDFASQKTNLSGQILTQLLGNPRTFNSTRFVILRNYFRHLLFCSNTFLLLSQCTKQPWSTGYVLICGLLNCKILVGNGCAFCACNGALYSYPPINGDDVCTHKSLSTFMLALSSLVWAFVMRIIITRMYFIS